MKKTILLSVFAALFVFGLSSCSDCKECRVVITENDSIISESSPEEYCGEDLEDIDGQEDVAGDQVTKWVCE